MAPAVRRLELRAKKGGTLDVPLFDCADIPEVRAAGLLAVAAPGIKTRVAEGAEPKDLDSRIGDARFPQLRAVVLCQIKVSCAG